MYVILHDSIETQTHFLPAIVTSVQQFQDFQNCTRSSQRSSNPKIRNHDKETKLTKLDLKSYSAVWTCKFHVDFQLKNHEWTAAARKQQEYQPTTHVSPATFFQDKQSIEKFVGILSISDACFNRSSCHVIPLQQGVLQSQHEQDQRA